MKDSIWQKPIKFYAFVPSVKTEGNKTEERINIFDK
jgi:hypothetical protein